MSSRIFARPAESIAPPSAPSRMFSSTLKGSTSMKCWNTMPMPAAIAVGAAAKPCGLAVDADFARIGFVEAVEDRHEGRFAGAVLADDPVDRAARHRKINRLIGVHGAEALVDAGEFDGGRSAGSRSSGKLHAERAGRDTIGLRRRHDQRPVIPMLRPGRCCDRGDAHLRDVRVQKILPMPGRGFPTGDDIIQRRIAGAEILAAAPQS